MKIKLDSLTYDELVELNQKIVERLKFLDTMHSHEEMMQFSIGEKVSFDAPGKGRQIATLIKYNKKTVSVITESGQKWNISPQVLSKVKNSKSKNSKSKNDHDGNVIDLYRK